MFVIESKIFAQPIMVSTSDRLIACIVARIACEDSFTLKDPKTNEQLLEFNGYPYSQDEFFIREFGDTLGECISKANKDEVFRNLYFSMPGSEEQREAMLADPAAKDIRGQAWDYYVTGFIYQNNRTGFKIREALREKARMFRSLYMSEPDATSA